MIELSLLRPVAPDELIDEEAFAHDEFLPYWAELWPAARALAESLPNVRGLRVIELGCGLGVPSLVAAARGARVTATDWAADAVELLRENAARNGLALEVEQWDWREPRADRYDLALAADVLYEERNVEPLLVRLRELAPLAYVGLAGRPYEPAFLRRAGGGRGRGRILLTHEQSRGRNDGGERNDPDEAEHASGKVLIEQGDAGCDRRCVREQRRRAGGLERRAALEPKLHRRTRHAPRDERDEQQMDRLRRGVTGRTGPPRAEVHGREGACCGRTRPDCRIASIRSGERSADWRRRAA